MLSYALIQFEVGPVQLLQEAWHGVVQRYTDLDGNTVVPPAGQASVIVGSYPRPAWAVDLTDPAPVSPDRRITKLAFRKRFTSDEKTALELAALHNTALAVTHPSNLLAASLRASMADQRDATFVDLERQDTRSGVQALESVALLASGRAAVILDSPVQEHERYTD